jgi:hypothetical protein
MKYQLLNKRAHYKFTSILNLFLLISILFSFSAHAKKHTVCEELKKSITYPKPKDIGKMKRKILVFDTVYTGIKEASRIVVTAGLGLTGLPISVGFNLLFQGMKMAGLEIGQNKRQMLAVVIVSEALLNNEIDINGHFGKADIMIFEDFLSAKKEFYKYVFKREKKEGIESDSMTFSNIAFARIIVELNYFDGYLTNESGEEIHIDGNEFYCKKKKSGRVRFRGFDHKARALLYSYYKNSKKKK